jgi:hypothetical protein
MTDTEFYALEGLLWKLGNYLGTRYAVVPNCEHDGYHIATYDKKTGDQRYAALAPSLKKAADEIIEKLNHQLPVKETI